MPTFTFAETTDGRTGGQAGPNGRTLPRSWDCFTDVVSNEAAVITALGAQLGVFRGVAHPDYSSCRCDTIGADIDPKTPLRWVVRATYVEPRVQPGTVPGGDPTGRPSGQTNNPAPADRAPLFKATYQRVPFSRAKDRANVPYKNPAGDWLENPPELVEGMAVFQVTRWYDNWYLQVGGTYLDNINSAPYVVHTPTGTSTFPAYKVRIDGIDAECLSDAGYVFWKVVFTLHGYVADKLWFPVKVLNIGRNVLDAAGKRQPAASTTNGRQMSGLTFLNADGTERDRSLVPTYTNFDVYDPIDFAAVLGI